MESKSSNTEYYACGMKRSNFGFRGGSDYYYQCYSSTDRAEIYADGEHQCM